MRIFSYKSTHIHNLYCPIAESKLNGKRSHVFADVIVKLIYMIISFSCCLSV